MTFRSPVGWFLVHWLPLLIIPLLAAAAASFTDGAVGVLCFTVLMAVLSVGQSLTSSIRGGAS